jgi:hypothetical protein
MRVLVTRFPPERADEEGTRKRRTCHAYRPTRFRIHHRTGGMSIFGVEHKRG